MVDHWFRACNIDRHAASAANKTYGGALWHVFVPLLAVTANTIPALAGITLTVLPLPIKWVALFILATTFITLTASKPTTVTQTLPSFRPPNMPKSTTKNNSIQIMVSGSDATHRFLDNIDF